MLWAGILAGLALAVAADDVISAPRPLDDTTVEVKDEGTTGLKRLEKPHHIKKATDALAKKGSHQLKATVKDEGAVGAQLREAGGVPPLKHISFPISTKKEESLDFEDEGPLVPAASSQSSRINVKKGPNGQEYEYEYVYYYYDDEEEEGGGKKATKKDEGAAKESVALHPKEDVKPEPAARQETPTGVREDGSRLGEAGARQDTSRQEQRIQEARVQEPRLQEARIQEPRLQQVRGQTQELRTQELRQEDRQSLRDEPHRHRADSSPRYGLDEEEPEAVRQRGNSGSRRSKPEEQNSLSRNRYTTIERGRVKAADLAVTSAEPSVNEILPTRSPSRSRGGSPQPEAVEEVITPTRFPGRSRVASTSEQQPTNSRGRQGGTGRRPSLVDSSSFRTHGTDGGPEEERLGYLSPQLDTRESDFEEYIKPTTFQPPQTTLPPSPRPVSPQQASVQITPPQDNTLGEMPEKAALDLYAILQQTQEENSVLDPAEEAAARGTDAPDSSELPPSQAVTTTPEPTTVPVVTTTTTTTALPPPQTSTLRGRFRSGGGRTRIRTQSSSTTTTTQTPEEEPPRREKFKPSHNRNPGQVSAYGRRRAGGSTTTTTEAAQPSSPRSRPSSSGGFTSSNRYRANRGRTSTPPATQGDDLSEEGEGASSTTPKPSRARITSGSGARPLRPGPRLNLRPRPSSSPAPEEPQPSEEPAATVAPEPAQQQPEGEPLNKLRNRPKLKPAVQPRPFSVANRRPIPGLRRRTTESEVESEVTTVSGVSVETELPPPAVSPSTEPPLPQTTGNKLSSLISRRRPLQRRIQPQAPADN